ncbi:hypothetical protein [Rhodospirillum centenum]|nr:hypothetical protein [Rhodospirillum centenum]
MTANPTLRRFLAVALLASPLALAACDNEGPAERAGAQLDEAAEETGEALENTGDRLERNAEEAGDRIEDRTDRN